MKPTAMEDKPKRAWGEATARPKSRPMAASVQTEVAPTGTSVTVVISNLPARCTRDSVIEAVHGEGFVGDVDFIYMPVDLKSKRCAGNAILNFRTGEACERFVNTFSGVSAKSFFPTLGGPRKLLTTPAPIQGREANLRKLGESSLFMSMLAEMPEWQPQVLDETGAVVELAECEDTNA